MNVSRVFEADPEVVASEVDDGAALLDLRSSQYYGLNPVGAFVWSRIQTPATLEDIVAAVADAFDVAPSECRADIARLLEDFESANVLRRHA